MTGRDFAALCEAHGFIRKKQCFFRCVGDGVYQTIRMNESCYIDPGSPYYSRTNRRSRRIAVGLFSIYSLLPERWFDPKFGAGTIDARNLVGDRGLRFFGIRDHYEIMERSGLAFLDGVDTQKKLVRALESLSEFDPSLVSSREICVPYLICGEREKARGIIESRLGDEHFLKWCAETTADDPKNDLRRKTLAEWEELREAAASGEKLRDYMGNNMRNNLRVSERYGIALKGSFVPLADPDGEAWFSPPDTLSP